MALPSTVMPARPANVFELSGQLAKVLAEVSDESVSGEVPDRARERVADLIEALRGRVTRRAEKDPRTLFELDDRLIDLMDAVEQHEAQGSAIPEELASEIDTYLEAHRQKVDRIAGYWRWQESIAAICGKEAERLQARRDAAAGRVRRLKEFLLAFMRLRGIRKLAGEKARSPPTDPDSCS